ncbi:MAG: flagellar basal body-associated FliL family protein, partial [Planctomycetota bacterium]
GDDGPDKKKLLLRLGMMALVMLLSIGGGLLASAVTGGPESAEAADEQEKSQEENAPPSDAGEWSYYEDFEPTVVTLNEPRVDRYLRAAIILKFRAGDFARAKGRIENRKRELTDWMIRYLSGLSLDEVRGQKNINRIRRKIKDALNEELWPEGRGRIEEVLMEEFAIQ